MARRRPNSAPISTPGPEAVQPEIRYVVDFEAMEAAGKSPEFFIRTRLCADAQPNAASAKSVKDLLKLMASECAGKPDFIAPNTPLTEAVFRLLLAAGNRPLSVRDIQDGLTDAWASVIYMKDLSEELLRRMLETPNAYFIGLSEAQPTTRSA
ncbi:MAG: hypothetical protein HY682_11440 [Chloroflexi bacterium]|nr:hypothetical protein [Chloroflexota bacterium]